MVSSSCLACVFATVACATSGDAGAPAFSSMFSSGAVLQRDTEVTVWGTIAGARPVTLYVDSELAAKAAVDASGNWTATLPPHAAAFGSSLTASAPGGNTSLPVQFGDVILCSGQSNMGMPVFSRPGAFQADNGSAEAHAAGRYSGGIWLHRQDRHSSDPASWVQASPDALGVSKDGGFSAVCWYTGKDYFERLGGKVPVGLLQASVGGSPIEYWMPVESIAKCETDEPRCDTKWPDAAFYDTMVTALQPYTLGAIVWDQAERDHHCNHISVYSCLLRELASSWRKAFQSPSAAFVVVQLPCYYDQRAPGSPGIPGFDTVAEGLFEMRLAQEAGLAKVEKSAIVATYDLSCNNEAFPGNCPWGSVHNPHKQAVGPRVAAQLEHLLQGATPVAEGPRVQGASIVQSDGNASTFNVSLRFAGGTTPFALRSTRNCTLCCEGGAGGDFDASHDGVTWAPGCGSTLRGGDTLEFQVRLPARPTHVRYTADTNFTQCALYNQESFPALPFHLKLEHDPASGVIVV